MISCFWRVVIFGKDYLECRFCEQDINQLQDLSDEKFIYESGTPGDGNASFVMKIDVIRVSACVCQSNLTLQRNNYSLVSTSRDEG